MIDNKLSVEDALRMSYKEYVEYLLEKYGMVKDDYFRLFIVDDLNYADANYKHWSLYEGKKALATNWSKGKTSRTNEGLIVHHIGEDREKLLSNPNWCMENSSDLELQQKENLVYCNYIEHYLLHIKIAVETDGSYGYDGISMIKNEITDMMNGNFTQKWKENCWNAIEPYMKSMISITEYLISWLKEYRDKHPECCKCGTTEDTFAGRTLLEKNNLNKSFNPLEFNPLKKEPPLKVYCKKCFDADNLSYGQTLAMMFEIRRKLNK